MNVEEFVKEFNEVENKLEFVEKHIVDDYVPFLKKVERCRTLVKCTTESTTEIDGIEKKFYLNNSANRHLLYMLELINYYTDIDINMLEPAKCYDELTKCKAIYLIYENLPAAEVGEWQMVLDMEVNDAYDNYRALPSWLDTKFETMKLFSDEFANALKDVDFESLKKE